MNGPTNTDQPFFSYGIFRPGQLAFFQLRDLVDKVIAPTEIKGELRTRDGLPIIDPDKGKRVKGALLTFLPSRTDEAYDRISRMEPDKHYRWHEDLVDGALANVLVGKSPTKGSEICKDAEWDGWNDPLFTAALEVVEETLDSDNKSKRHHPEDAKPAFRLQMAYLLLWSSIERYVSLRYHLGDKATDKVNQLATEPAFKASLSSNVNRSDTVFRADKPKCSYSLDPQNSEMSLKYYYQVRSNITHRGKAVVKDYELVRMSLTELLAIFREVLKAAQTDAQYSF